LRICSVFGACQSRDRFGQDFVLHAHAHTREGMERAERTYREGVNNPGRAEPARCPPSRRRRKLRRRSSA